MKSLLSVLVYLETEVDRQNQPFFILIDEIEFCSVLEIYKKFFSFLFCLINAFSLGEARKIVIPLAVFSTFFTS